ncbi:MAG: hypothetical protein WD029_10700 [Microthrixaceae bacterium]
MRTTRLRRTLRLAACVAVGSAVVCVAPSVSAEVSDDAPLGRAESVLVFSVPTLAWEEVTEQTTPNLYALLKKSVIADLSVRSVSRDTSAVDGYTTLNAGTRSEGTEEGAVAYKSPEGNLGSQFALQTGTLPAAGEVFNLGLVSTLNLNDSLLFGAEVGALGTALRQAGVQRGVVANGDHTDILGQLVIRREASLGLIDSQGVVEAGAIGPELLEDDDSFPFGVRYNNRAVAESAAMYMPTNSVLLVEASDMVRAEDAKLLSTSQQQLFIRSQAIRHSDELLGRLLDKIKNESTAVLVVAPNAIDNGSSLTVMGVHSPQVQPGLLSSGTTRRAGFVQTVDIAPTIASLLGVAIPSSMEGTLMERKGSGGTYLQRTHMLISANTAAAFRDSVVGPASTLFVLVQLLLWVLAILAMSRSSLGLRKGIEIATLGVLAFLPITYLAGIFPFEEWGRAAFWLFIVGGSALLAVTIYLLTQRFLVDPLLATLGLLLLLLSGDILIGGPLQFNTVFGYTPTVAGRFNGMGNPAFAMFAASAIMAAALIAYRVGGRIGIWLGIALLGWAVLLDGAPFWGADVGGALAMIPSAGVTAWMLLGLKVRLRTAALWGSLSILLVIALGALDLTRPAAERTHLGRLLSDIGANGFEALNTVVLRKLDANFSVLASSVWTLMLPVVFAFIAYLFWKAPWRLRKIAERIPQERAAVAGLLTAMVLGFALNDSGIAVPGIMLGVVSASLIHLMLRVDTDSNEESLAVSASEHPLETSSGA